MPIYVDCCRLIHINGAKKNRTTVCSKDQTLLGLAGDYSRFDLSHNVSREHARLRGVRPPAGAPRARAEGRRTGGTEARTSPNRARARALERAARRR